MAQAGIALGALLPGGATVADAAGNAWGGALGPLPDFSGVLVQADLSPPVVVGVVLEPAGPIGLGAPLVFEVQFSEPVLVVPGVPPPVLEITLAGQPVQAVLLPGAVSQFLRFVATLPEGLVGTGIGLVGLSGTITDLAGHPLAGGLPGTPALATILLDGVAPVASLLAPAAGRLIPGEVLHLTLATTEPVHLADGLTLPGLLLDTDGGRAEAVFDPALSTPASLVFTLPVQPGLEARAGLHLVGLDDPDGALRDAAGNPLQFIAPEGLLAVRLWPVDQTAPEAIHASEPVPGAGFDLILEFSEPLILSGTPPVLTVVVDGTPMLAGFAGTPQPTLLAFHLDLPGGAALPQDIELGAAVLAGAHVADAAGNDWDGSGLAGTGWHYALAGDATLAGGLGDDLYRVDGPADLVIEFAGQGDDTVIAAADTYLTEDIEQLTLAEGGDWFGVGNALANVVAGNAGANLLIGMDGADSLLGEAGQDTLYGVAGDDSLAGGPGADYLIAGDGADAVDGGIGADVLYGEAGDDSLAGGAGLDYLIAGDGDDTLVGGVDADVLYGEAGNDSLSGGADFVFDMLVAGEGNDTLDGASGLGDPDYLFGQTGDDSYRVDTPGNLVFEAPGEGQDTVFADIVGAGYYLYAGIEDLVLLGITPFGVGNDLDNRLTGNAMANWLLGGEGADTLEGGGGGDVLFGQAGADRFVFRHGTGGDVIGDFTPGEDRLDLAGLGFTTAAQVLAASVQAGDSLAIDLGQGDFIVLLGTSLAALGAGDFILA